MHKKARPKSGSVFVNLTDCSQLAVALVERVEQPEVEKHAVAVCHGPGDIRHRTFT